MQFAITETFSSFFKDLKYPPNYLDSQTTEHLRAEVSIYYEKIEKSIIIGRPTVARWQNKI